MAVKKGDLVKVNYVGKYETGEIFDQSNDKPLEFIAGGGMVVKGFDNAIIGMEKGEKKNITIKSENAYGVAKQELIQEVPKQAFGDKVAELKEGMTIGLNHPQMPGQMMPALIKKIEAEMITLDLNHPLAGKNLVFDLEVVDFHEATEEDKKKFMPPTPQEKPEEKKEESLEDSCDGDCAGCGHKH
jgi:peptidylprolyl isomerase